MAATLKLGDRKWATKEGSLLAYNDENNNFKPLPFDFTRASSATRVNKQGLIETVASGVPRIDFTNANGALLLEPQRTNLVTYSEAFDNAAWTKSVNTAISANATTSPDGTQNADTITWSTSGGTTQLYQVKSTTGTSQSLSIFVKYISGSGTGFLFSIGTIADASINLTFTNSGATLTGVAGVDVTSYKIEDYGNNWFRVSFAANYAAVSAEFNVYRPSGTGTDVYAIYGAQLESSASYATSYIPTQGSAVTRIVDVCSQTVPDGIIGQTEGTLFVDYNFTSSSNTLDATPIRILGSGSASVYFEMNTNETLEVVVINSAGALIFNSISPTQSVGRIKVAVVYKDSDYAYYINGTQIAVQTSGAFNSASFTSLNLGSYSSGVQMLSDSVNQAILFPTRLSNAELEALTTL